MLSDFLLVDPVGLGYSALFADFFDFKRTFDRFESHRISQNLKSSNIY